jgi:SAM-dependent methyltransferase
MKLTSLLQPDQDPRNWDDYVAVYEEAFEPLTDFFGAHALDLLSPLSGKRLIDVAAGAGGVALEGARRGAVVTAVDASRKMVERVRARAAEAWIGSVVALPMDGTALAFPDASFDIALSVFGVVLFPDPTAGVRELARVVRPGGRLAIVTWTEPDRYELAARLREAIAQAHGPLPSGPLPAQLRHVDPAAFAALVASAGLDLIGITRVEGALRAKSPRQLGMHLAFAPGLSALLGSLGDDREAAIDAFVRKLAADKGEGAVALEAVAHIALASKS